MNAPEKQPLVYVVDDDDALCDSLRWLLASAGYRVSTHLNAECFLRSYKAGLAVCLVLDVRMPGLSGLELQQELIRRGGTLPIIFVTGHGDVPMAVEAVKNGAFHFLEKPFKDEQLLRLIDGAARKAVPVSAHAQRLCAAARLATLTQREREVMDLVVQGRKNKQIADDLRISIKTVEAHRARAMEKMDVSSVAELVRATLTANAPI
jgi:two-component system response regulator TtrR